MSASREKKQRQGAGLSEKALQAQREQAARKRKTVTYTVIGVVIAVLVAALLIWRTGFFQGRATAATVGSNKFTVAEMNYYYYNARMREFYYYSYFGMTPPSDSTVRDNETGQTYREYFLENALQSAQENLVLAEEARRSGHTEAEVKDRVDAQIKSLKTEASSSGYSYSSYLKAMYGPYISAGMFKKLYTRDLLASLVYNERGTELYDGYTDDDLWAYYNADDHADSLNTFKYSYLYFTPEAVEDKDSDGNALDEDTVAELKSLAMAKAKANAEAAEKALQDGGDIASLAEEYELADANFGDHVTAVGISSAVSALQDTLLSMEADDVELVENGESGFYVVTLHSNVLVETPTRDVRHILIKAETTTDESGNTVAPTAEAWAAAQQKIEAIQAEYEAGNRTEDSFAALANEKSDDGDGTTGGLYSDIDVNSRYVPEFLDWIFADGRKVGDTGIVQHDAGDTATGGYWGYHFIYLAAEHEPTWKITVRDTLTGEELRAWVDELTADYPAALTGGANNVGV